MDDHRIAEQVLEAEDVIRELAGQMQRAVEVADTVADAKMSYEESQIALENAAKELTAGLASSKEVVAATIDQLSAASARLHGTETALNALTSSSVKVITRVQQEVKEFSTKIDKVQNELRANIEVASDKALHAQASVSQDLVRASAKLDALDTRLSAIMSALVSIDRSTTAIDRSAAAIESAIWRSADTRSQELSTKINRVLWVAVITLVSVAGLIVFRLLMH